MALQNKEQQKSFNAIALKLASPDRVREWSFGEVTRPETINYRTQRSERGGLFDERIFGPEKDYECYCGKYRRIRYKDIICEKCGVEVTRSIVRRERMGHIELASPVAHIWFLRGVPSRIGTVLNLPVSDLEKVIYFAGYIITKVHEDEKAELLRRLDAEFKAKSKAMTDKGDSDKLRDALLEAKREVESLSKWRVLDEMSYHKYSIKYATVFEAGIGAEAIHNIFRGIDLTALAAELEEGLSRATSLDRARIQKRYNLIKSMMSSGVRPEWMFLTVIPIIPPALRPMVALDGGRHATSDVNDLYRRVINRNNRLKKLKELSAPDVILRNEKRILQEAVDDLLDNSIHARSSTVATQQRRALKSLSDSIKGKQGRFRQNLLGKRVDYSGRSVIVVGPDLKLHQCGLPKHMALELFRPFVISKLLAQELAYNIRGAGKLIEEEIPEVWAILEEVIHDKRVLLNRAPTLHRLGIQAFQPVLIEGNAIQVHPLVCSAFNADFDGDQMAVHVPLSKAAQREARELIASNRNLLRPGSGDPVVNPTLDIVLGVFWMTTIAPGEVGEANVYADYESAGLAHSYQALSLRAAIKVKKPVGEKYAAIEGDYLETTLGRLMFNSIFPDDFAYLNKEITRKDITEIVSQLIDRYGVEKTPDILDNIKYFGFHYATISGVTWGIDDVDVPAEKAQVIIDAKQEAAHIEDQYADGLLSEEERFRMIIEVWQRTKMQVDKLIPASLPEEGSVSMMLRSGARGSINQIGQMSGMKGLIVNPAGNLVDYPIIPSYKEGLSPIEYFVTTHGSRKTLADTALNTAKAGYLTRKLVDVSQDVVIREEDCGTKDGKKITMDNIPVFDSGIGHTVRGRVLAEDLKAPDGSVIFPRGHLVLKSEIKMIDELQVPEAVVRSPLSCKSVNGLCQACYGKDLGRGTLVNIGETVGIVAAQAIGEPGTQLTMRTKHSGGVDTKGDIVGGLPRVEEIFERRIPKNAAVLSEVDGTVAEVRGSNKERIIVVIPDPEHRGKKKQESIEYAVYFPRSVIVKEGDEIKRGQVLTDGPIVIPDLFKLAGHAAAEDYILKEIESIYHLQGASISRKHIEVMIRQMLSRRKIKTPGDSRFVSGEIVEMRELTEENMRIQEEGGEEAVGDTLVLGISEVALNTESFLSAASFQNTTRILINTAIKGGVDRLRGLKENVIIGRLIPAGTGIRADFALEDVPEEGEGVF